MSVKNVTVADLALIELSKSGRTDAPREVLADLERRGFVAFDRAGRPSLTGRGSKRAEALKPCEPNLRAMAMSAATGHIPVRMGGGQAALRF